jgi:hypothetical protein
MKTEISGVVKKVTPMKADFFGVEIDATLVEYSAEKDSSERKEFVFYGHIPQDVSSGDFIFRETRLDEDYEIQFPINQRLSLLSGSHPRRFAFSRSPNYRNI